MSGEFIRRGPARVWIGCDWGGEMEALYIGEDGESVPMFEVGDVTSVTFKEGDSFIIEQTWEEGDQH